MQNPPQVDGGHRRPMSDDCDVIIHDVEDGVVLVVENRDKIMYTMRFDFGASQNLTVKVGTGVEEAGPMKCNIEVQPGTVRNLCHLQIADRMNQDHFEMKYRVQCLVRNAKGELEQVKPPAPKAEKEERKKITETLDIIFLDQGAGYVVFFESRESRAAYQVTFDISGSKNLELMTGPGVNCLSETSCSFSVPAGERKAVAKLDPIEGGQAVSLAYRVKQEKEDDGAGKAAAEAAAKKKADDDAARKKAEENAARKKAEDDAARKKAEDDAARKKAEDDAARKKAEDDAARRKAEEDAARKVADEEAARKRAEEEAARKRAADDAARKKADEDAAMRAKLEAEWRLKLEAEYRIKFEALFSEEIRVRERYEVEQRGKFVLLQREYRESICNLCRGLFKPGQDFVPYKIYKLHKVCYDRAPKCDWCGDILIGEYVVTKGDLGSGTKLHKDCIEPYKKKARPVCSGCNQQIMDDQWSSLGGKPFHHTCRK
jgi:hypothetical protein